MTNKEIKELLINMFVLSFNINNLIDINGELRQEFEFTTSFEFKHKNRSNNETWHEVTMSVTGVAYLKQGCDDYHDSTGDGRSENQGEANCLESFNIEDINVYLNGNTAAFEITFDDLNQFIDYEK